MKPQILTESKTIAVVGLSDMPERASDRVKRAHAMQGA
jgi:predicted CoA-binding protein